ncbi:MAG TPA: TonB-dependent receptor [Gemmatimonadaceae bacterium]|nr:TonB-dependent receptor [Gemmatimonadaceae bacterium]
MTLTTTVVPVSAASAAAASAASAMSRAWAALAVLLVGVTSVLAPGPLQAQESAGDTATVLAPVAVTATRLTVEQNAPTITTTVISGAELRGKQITTLQDALQLVPGVLAARSGSYGGQTSLFVRGGQSDYVQVLVDGAPVNDPGGFLDIANIGIDNVDRIEVVRGPASVLYGANAVTGVVQIFTRDGRGPGRLTLGMSGGSYGARDGQIAVRGGSERASGSLSFAHHGSDGIYDFNNASREDAYSGALRLEPDDRSSIQLSLGRVDARSHIPTNGFGVPDDSNQFHDVTRSIGSIDAGRFLTRRLEARVLLTASDAHTRSADLPDTPEEECAFCYDARTGTYRAGADARLALYASRDLALTAGTVYERQRQHSSGSEARGRTLKAVYTQAAGNLGERASYGAGVRVDDNSAFGTFTTYRLSAGCRFGVATRVHASLGTAFKEPTVDQTSSTSPFVRGNPDLRPERTRSWELGVTQSLLSGSVVLSATYFNQRFRDVIQYDPMPPAEGDPNYVNVGAARANGAELEARAAFARIWDVTASYTRLATRVTDAGVDAGAGATYVQGERLLRRPSNLAHLGVGVRPSPRGAVHLDVGYVGNRVDIDFANFERVDADAYTTVDLSGELSLLTARDAPDPLALTLRVENLFDSSYQQIFGYRSPGRAVHLGVKMRLGL